MLKKFQSGHWPIFIMSSLSSLGNLFLPIILVRLLTPEDIGFYKIFFLQFAALPYIFLTGGALHSVYYWAGKPIEERQSLLNATWVITIILSSLIFVIGYPLKPYFSSYMDIPSEYIFILLLSGSMTSMASYFNETSIALGKKKALVIETVIEFIRVLGFIVIAFYYKDIYYIFLYFLIHMFLRLVLVVSLNKKMNQIGFKTSKKSLLQVFKYSLPMSITGLLGFFSEKLDLFILSDHLTARDFAFYSMGCLIIPPLYLLEMSVQKNLIPSLSKSHTLKDYEGGSLAYRKAIKDISFLMIPAIFGIITFTIPIVELLYTGQYIESAPFLKIFAFSYILLMLPHDSVARATGKTDWILKIYLLITPLILVAGYTASANYGAQGVLIVTLLLRFIPKYYGLRLSKKIMNWRWKEMFPTKHLILFTAISLILSTLSLVIESYFKTSLQWFLICAPIYGIIYLVTAYKLGAKAHYDKIEI